MSIELNTGCVSLLISSNNYKPMIFNWIGMNHCDAWARTFPLSLSLPLRRSLPDFSLFLFSISHTSLSIQSETFHFSHYTTIRKQNKTTKPFVNDFCVGSFKCFSLSILFFFSYFYSDFLLYLLFIQLFFVLFFF